ncbi:2-C-methyl-D-erythritol 4-phosphate cytidylyltransferase [Sutcliffiella rhizosphaerae]|uniref:2-C-methyl-D-erythritol 4-phosphate cytidylyltransferase n=1 Tax=Sutcliffiella rhizosphaerae TaxID=2880967 RepID=A0ABN8AAL2_9BACI|nr:2-C-methyl-D-erythritol 4-phosphate cytidylyltransferase [Sutcliffiella rhizosphaerae]CAG9622246.1 2-C-methyl-D-erythritol 4-phosphate cytidylyltransferase [Sutcliffiella rhizosphaerae]
MNYHVIVLAAGQGKRMKAGINKQFIELEGKPVIIHTLSVFEKDPHCQEIKLVINEKESDIFHKLLTVYPLKKVKEIVFGGKERQDSVYNGLIATDTKGIVLVHDGARPFVSNSVIHRLVDAAAKEGAAIVGVPVKDTIKKVGHDQLVEETVERSSLWSVQTPQAFRFDILMNAHEEARKTGYQGTDEASLVERISVPVKMVEGDYENIKLTTPEDLILAKAILQK